MEERSRMGTNSILWTDMRHRKPRTGKKEQKKKEQTKTRRGRSVAFPRARPVTWLTVVDESLHPFPQREITLK